MFSPHCSKYAPRGFINRVKPQRDNFFGRGTVRLLPVCFNRLKAANGNSIALSSREVSIT